MRWINRSNKIKKYWAELAAKRKRAKEKRRMKSMKVIEKAEEEAGQEDADAENSP